MELSVTFHYMNSVLPMPLELVVAYSVWMRFVLIVSVVCRVVHWALVARTADISTCAELRRGEHTTDTNQHHTPHH